MILTVTCNPAVDVTYLVDDLVPGDVHRVREVRQLPGGKGISAARVLHQVEEDVVALGLADAGFGRSVEALGVAADFLDVLPSVRRTVVVQHGATPVAGEVDLRAYHEFTTRVRIEPVESLMIGADG